MREFERREIFTSKCIICGCKNKIHTELLNRNNKFVGYSLTCCGCGNKHDFMLDYQDNGSTDPVVVSMDYHKGRQRCIRPSYCPRTDCKLYNLCFCDDDCKCNYKTHPNDKNQGEDNKIEVEVIHKPEFL